MKLWQAIVVVALFWAAVFLPGLGSTELKGEEARRVLPGRLMLENGDWVVPQVGGKPYARKPPLVNWTAAVSFALTGNQDSFSARLPSVLAVLALGMGIVLGTRRWLGPGVASAAALVALANHAVVEKGRLAEIEPTYVALTGIAFAVWSGAWVRRANLWLTWAVPGLFLGLGMLAKGPVHLLFFYFPVVAACFVGRQWRGFFHPAHFAGLVLTFAPTVLWAAAYRRRLEAMGGVASEADDVWVAQLMGRLSPENFSILAWMATPFEACLNFLPWVLLLVPLWWWASQRGWPVAGGGRVRAWARGTAWGIGVSFFLVVLVPESSARYTHPLVPAAALLTVVLWQAAEGSSFGRRLAFYWRRGIRAGRVALATGLVAGPLALLVLLERGDVGGSGVVPGLAFAAALVALVVGAGLGRSLRNVTSLAPASACVLGGLVLVFVGVSVPVMRQHENVRPVGAEVMARLPEGARLCVLNPGIAPFLFYLEPGVYTVVDRAGRIPESTTHLLASDRVYRKVRGVAGFEAFRFVPFAEVEDPRGGETWHLLVAARHVAR